MISDWVSVWAGGVKWGPPTKACQRNAIGNDHKFTTNRWKWWNPKHAATSTSRCFFPLFASINTTRSLSPGNSKYKCLGTPCARHPHTRLGLGGGL